MKKLYVTVELTEESMPLEYFGFDIEYVLEDNLYNVYKTAIELGERLGDKYIENTLVKALATSQAFEEFNKDLEQWEEPTVPMEEAGDYVQDILDFMTSYEFFRLFDNTRVSVSIVNNGYAVAYAVYADYTETQTVKDLFSGNDIYTVTFYEEVNGILEWEDMHVDYFPNYEDIVNCIKDYRPNNHIVLVDNFITKQLNVEWERVDVEQVMRVA